MEKSAFSAIFHITQIVYFLKGVILIISSEMAAVNDIDVLSACFMKDVCCKLTYPAAIMDAMVHGF